MGVGAQTDDQRPTSRSRGAIPPSSWDPSRGPAVGVVELPLRLYWSDGHNRFDLADPVERRLLYQTVLREGTSSDAIEYLHLPTLLDIWDTLWLPTAVHQAWDAWIAAHRHPAV